MTSKLEGALPAARRVKLRKYQDLVRAQGDTFVTFGWAISGAYLPEVGIWIKRMVEAGKENDAARALTTKEIRDRLATALQVGNGLVQIGALKAMRSKAPERTNERRRHTGRLLSGRKTRSTNHSKW